MTRTEGKQVTTVPVATTAQAVAAGVRAPAQRTPRKRAKKVDPSGWPVAAGEEAWTAEELSEVIGDLSSQHERISSLLGDLEAQIVGLMRDAGDGAGADTADIGATSFERDHEITVASTEREMLEQIEHAQSRIDSGTYGVCESCGGAVGKMRLMAFPRATMCMSCKQREERR